MNKLLDERINEMVNLTIGMPGPIHLCEFEPLLNFPDEEDIEEHFDTSIFEHVELPYYK